MRELCEALKNAWLVCLICEDGALLLEYSLSDSSGNDMEMGRFYDVKGSAQMMHVILLLLETFYIHAADVLPSCSVTKVSE